MIRIEAGDSRNVILEKALEICSAPREERESNEYVLQAVTTLQLRDAYGSAVLRFGMNPPAADSDPLLAVVSMMANELDDRIRRLELDVSGGGAF